MKKPYSQVINFINKATDWLSSKDNEDKLDSKFAYALNKVKSKCYRVYELFQEDVEDINIEYCSTDAESVIVRDERGQYKFTKENMQKRIKAIRALQNKVVEIEPHIASDVPSGLSFDQQEAFEDFVIKSKLEVAA